MKNNNGLLRIEAWQRRAEELRVKIAAEQDKRRKREAREQQRLSLIIGAALVHNAALHPDFELMLKSILQTAVSAESDKNFLRRKGWL